MTLRQKFNDLGRQSVLIASAWKIYFAAKRLERDHDLSTDRTLDFVSEIGSQIENFSVFVNEQPDQAQTLVGTFIELELRARGRPADLDSFVDILRSAINRTEEELQSAGEGDDLEMIEEVRKSAGRLEARIDLIANKIARQDQRVIKAASAHLCHKYMMDEFFEIAFEACDVRPSSLPIRQKNAASAGPSPS